MSSSDEEARSPELGASSSKDPPPQLESESEHDEQVDAEENSASDSSSSVECSKKARYYNRPRAEWTTVLQLKKGEAATMDEDEMKIEILRAANGIMENLACTSFQAIVPSQPTLARGNRSELGLWMMTQRMYIGTSVPCLLDSAVRSKSKLSRTQCSTHIT
jgi:hypothetical protein